MLKIMVAVFIAGLLSACGGGDEPLTEDEIFREQAFAEMQKTCAKRGGVQSWEWHYSYYPAGPLKGEVFGRSYTAVCGPDANGSFYHFGHLPPQI